MKRRPHSPPIPSESAAPHAVESVPRTGVAIAAIATIAIAAEGLLESFLLRDRLWGSHFYGFLPPVWTASMVLALAIGVVFAIRLARQDDRRDTALPAEPSVAGRALPWWIPWAVGAIAAALFWVLRERHTFWGDGTALVVNLPRGQAFHPDEPLTLFVHQLLYRALGSDSAATAIALGSVLAGGLFAGWTVHWVLRRLPARIGALASAAMLVQGFTQIFYGHVENYSYVALGLLVFFTSGIDAIEGRGGYVVPMLALVAAFAFHVLGAIAFVSAAVLIAHGLFVPARRRAVLLAILLAGLLAAAGLSLSAGLYDTESPFGRVFGGVFKLIANPTDTRLENALTWRRAADVWSALMLLGPLSLPLVFVWLVALRGGAFLRTSSGAFLGSGALAATAPVLLAGPGNLGAARNWDLLAAGAIVPALFTIVWVSRGASSATSRPLVGLLLVVSAFHTIPWIALNASFTATANRIAHLPLGNGRGETMLGTHYLNANALPEAELWFRRAVGRAPDNPNAESGLGLALARQNRYEDAVAPMSAAVRLKPDESQYRHDIVTLLLQLERWENAARHLEALVGLDPENRLAWHTLVHLRLRLGEPDTAAFVARSGLRVHPGDRALSDALSDALAMQVTMHRVRNDEARASRSLRALEAAFPLDPRLEHLRRAP